jgi:hypothetical protein
LERNGIGGSYLDEEDVSAGFCEGEGHGLANSSCATCHEGSLPCEGEKLLNGGHGCGLHNAVVMCCNVDCGLKDEGTGERSFRVIDGANDPRKDV